ncbi:MAG TPA: DUF4350 domain-containing protein [Flavisolibacter sp.]|nr:DUF4350 domain-containing protein [Flavisolibacter sp.]
MKKIFPYILGGVVLLLLVGLILASRSRPVHRMDERITLRQRDKIPYGTAVAKHLLPSLLSRAVVYFDSHYPGTWENIDPYASGQAVFLMADYLEANYDELDRLSRFVSKGNVVFIISRSLSDEASRFFHLRLKPFYSLFSGNEDSLQIRLVPPVFEANGTFTYPGKRYEGAIQKLDSGKTVVLGRNERGWVNFVRMDKGDGSFYIHTAPLAFSNYFLLYKNNIAYYENVISVLPQKTRTVLWSEYFLEKLQNPSGEKDVNWLGALFKNPAFRWGFLTAMATLLLFVLLGMRRKQRMIPPHERPTNDSLDFVKTLGRLYYDKSDHKNLAEKMGAYFMEHVRSTYHIAAHTPDEEFVALLHRKSGYGEAELKTILTDIKQFQQSTSLSEEQLARFYRQLEMFYQNT